MFRGRVGYDALGNRQLREKELLKKREEHLAKVARITPNPPIPPIPPNPSIAPKVARIMTRRPPLDPLTPDPRRWNPRKKAVAKLKNVLTERENKSLLKRISCILTAPPKVTDEDYQRMRALVAGTRGDGKKIFERKLQDKRMKAFFSSLAQTGPYYNPSLWEKDYQKQLLKQRFLRQVTYVRPPGFIDPLAPIPEPEPEPRRHYHHISRVRALRGHRESSTSILAPSTEGAEEGGEDDYGDDDFDDAVAGVVRLAQVRRLALVTDTDEGISLRVPLNVRCVLVGGSTLVVTALGEGEGRGIAAEAEIGLSELRALRGGEEESDKLEGDVLRSLATELCATLEVRIEEGEARLVLNLADGPEGEGGEGDYKISRGEEGGTAEG